MTQLTISDKLRNLNHDIRSSDLQSDSDLDSIRNSCDVSMVKPVSGPMATIPIFNLKLKILSQKGPLRGGEGGSACPLDPVH